MGRVTGVCLFAVAANLLLFGVKLYIGLRANSISVYSDAVNNLFDSLSAAAAFAGLYALSGVEDLSAKHALKKGEQLFSLLISAIVCGAGAYFAYASIERFLYPAPVWYTPLQLGALIGTALAKLAMFAVYRAAAKKDPSPVLRVMRMDCVLDFFITSVAVLTLAISGRAAFSFDALAGLAISAAIVAPAVKSALAAGAALIDYVPAQKRDAVNAALAEAISNGAVAAIDYTVFEAEILCFVSLTAPVDLEAPREALRGMGIRLLPVMPDTNNNI